MKLFALVIFGCSALSSQVNVLTSNYDNNRTSWNSAETILTPAHVNVNEFGKLFSLPVDGTVFAQPLYVSSGTRNMLIVATLHNSIYAFDADIPGPSLWQVNLGPSVPSDDYSIPDQGFTFTDVTPEVGILSTPVIDFASNTIFVVANTVRDGVHSYELHALDLLSGAEKNGGPVTIQADIAGGPTFDPFLHLQRPGLLLSNGHLYIGFGSHGDIGDYHGWLLAYDAASLQPVWTFAATPSGEAAAIWQSGRGIASDSDGFIYFVTGNGDYDGAANWGESVLRLDPQSGTVTDWFTPKDWRWLNNMDSDFGSAGVILVPGTSFAIAGGKAGFLYVMDRANLGHLEGQGHPIIHKLGFLSARSKPQIIEGFGAIGFGIHNFAYWGSSSGSYVYLRANNDVLKAFLMNPDGTFQTQPASLATTGQGSPFDGLTVSSNGSDSTTGIVWQSATDSFTQPSNGTLHAYLASDVSQELWNSAMMASRDGYGTFVKFANPTVADGKVYVPTASNQIAVYGLLPPASTASHTGTRD